MSHLFPLKSEIVLALSAVEFVAGLLKSSFGLELMGVIALITLGLVEAVCGIVLSISIIREIRTLEFIYSKVMFSMAVGADLLYLILDLLSAYLSFLTRSYIAGQNGQNGSESEASTFFRKLLSVVRNGVQTLASKNFWVVLTPVIIVFLPPLIVSLILFSRLEWSFSSVEISELTNKKEPPGSYWMSFSGFILIDMAGCVYLTPLVRYAVIYTSDRGKIPLDYPASLAPNTIHKNLIRFITKQFSHYISQNRETTAAHAEHDPTRNVSEETHNRDARTKSVSSSSSPVQFIPVFIEFFYGFVIENFSVVGMLGAPLILGGGLRTTIDLVPGFAYVSAISIPPILSFVVTTLRFQINMWLNGRLSSSESENDQENIP